MGDLGALAENHESLLATTGTQKLYLKKDAELQHAVRVQLQRSGPRIAKESQERRFAMEYLSAWFLGIPGGLIVIWFLLNHMH